MDGKLYEMLNRAWIQTCKILFGEEIGELKEYETYIKSFLDNIKIPNYGKFYKHVKSEITGKEVGVFLPFYNNKAKFIEMNAIATLDIKPLHLDEIKDIDSIVNAWRERWYYRAGVIQGNSTHVEKSDAIYDSHWVYNSYLIEESQYIFHSLWVRDKSKYLFASGGGPDISMSIRSFYGGMAKRLFEAYMFISSSDVYFSHTIIGSNEIMFSFSQRGKHYVIGNLELEPNKYRKIKESLLEQIRAELTSKKSLPSLIELINGRTELPKKEKVNISYSIKPSNFDKIDEGFRKTIKLLIKEEFSLKELDQFLSKKRNEPPIPIKSFFGKEGYFYPIVHYTQLNSFSMKNRISFWDEMDSSGSIHLTEQDISSFDDIKKNIGKIALITQEIRHGNNSNLIQVMIGVNSSNIYRVIDAALSKHQAISFIGCPSSNYVYGSSMLFHSTFAINSNKGDNLNRVFETDQCSNSSDIYFSHNIEGSNDVMFSQHLKGTRYTIGNLVLDKEKYYNIKDSLLSQIRDELRTKHTLHIDIEHMGV